MTIGLSFQGQDVRSQGHKSMYISHFLYFNSYFLVFDKIGLN